MNTQMQIILNSIQMLKAQLIALEQQVMAMMSAPMPPPGPWPNPVPPPPPPVVLPPQQQPTPAGYTPPGIAPGTPPNGI